MEVNNSILERVTSYKWHQRRRFELCSAEPAHCKDLCTFHADMESYNWLKYQGRSKKIRISKNPKISQGRSTGLYTLWIWKLLQNARILWNPTLIEKCQCRYFQSAIFLCQKLPMFVEFPQQTDPSQGNKQISCKY